MEEIEDPHLMVIVPNQGEGSVATVQGSLLRIVTQEINNLTTLGWELLGPVQFTERDGYLSFMYNATLVKPSNLQQYEHQLDMSARRRRAAASPV
ncbi:hypothetical protein KBC70_02815 [Candidatus Woesebacteria bacterium]|nr:hypothetical protein [Candidatus Woesebacteria bacterium]